MTPTVALILPMAGLGRRFGGPVPKPYLPLCGSPVFLRTLERFADIPQISFRLIAVAPSDVEHVRRDFAAQLAALKVDAVVAGGAERFDTVRQALQRVPHSIDLVAVHDAVRPLVPRQAIIDSFDVASRIGAACVGVPLIDTLKRATPEGIVLETVPRDHLWQIQTPQVFRAPLLRAAYQRLEQVGGAVTDDCRLLEDMGHPIAMVHGGRQNLKITTPEDLHLAEVLWNSPTLNA